MRLRNFLKLMLFLAIFQAEARDFVLESCSPTLSLLEKATGAKLPERSKSGPKAILKTLKASSETIKSHSFKPLELGELAECYDSLALSGFEEEIKALSIETGLEAKVIAGGIGGSHGGGEEPSPDNGSGNRMPASTSSK